jgi:hypothetical protein
MESRVGYRITEAGPLSLAADGFLRLCRQQIHEKDKYPKLDERSETLFPSGWRNDNAL